MDKEYLWRVYNSAHPRAFLPLLPVVAPSTQPVVVRKPQGVQKVKDVKEVKESWGKLVGVATLLGYQNTTAPTGSYKLRKLKPQPQQEHQSENITSPEIMTSPERKLLELLGPDWIFVGNRKLKIGRLFPDFVNIKNGKLLIELYGDWWHRGQNPQERINLFKQLGYSCLVIWAHELKAPDQVLLKIINYQAAGSSPGQRIAPMILRARNTWQPFQLAGNP